MNGTDIDDTVVIRAAMDLCATQGWRSLSIEQIAQQADIPLDLLQTRFACKDDILNALFDQLDRSLMVVNDMPDESVRDKLFAMMMERLDLAAPYRPALTRMRKEGLPRRTLCRSQQWLEQLLIKADTPARWRPIHGMALGAIWLMVLPTWFQDDSQDLAKTMAALDTQLGHAEHLWLRLSGWWQHGQTQAPL